jgi:hypothetical protein
MPDYDPRWFLNVHVASFPNGTGGPPEGMSLKQWLKVLLSRFPREQYGGNPYLVLDAFNILQRHEVNTSARVQQRLQPNDLEEIGNLTIRQYEAVLGLLARGARGSQHLSRLVQELPPGAGALVRSFKVAGGRVFGSPQSFASLRAKMMSLSFLLGPYTAFITLNPSELNADIVFDMAGRAYTFSADGTPGADRPAAADRYRIIASNPTLSAEFFTAFMRTFQVVFLGWPEGEPQQVDPHCYFGKITGSFFKYECTARGGLHGHGQAVMPDLKPDRLEAFMAGDFKAAMLTFVEDLMCQVSVPSLVPITHMGTVAT